MFVSELLDLLFFNVHLLLEISVFLLIMAPHKLFFVNKLLYSNVFIHKLLFELLY